MTNYLQTVEWSIPHVLAVLGGGYAGAVVATIGIVVVYGEDLTLVAFVLASVGQAAGGLLVLAYLSRKVGTGSFATDFGFEVRLRHWWGLPAGFALQIAVALITAPLLQQLFPEGPPRQEIVEITEGAKTLVEVVLITFALVILAPVVEEILFRGMLLSRLLRSMSISWAIVVQAAAFAAIHLILDPRAIAAVFGLFLIAIVLGYAAIRSGSLSLPIFLHAGVNLTAAVVLLYGQELIDWLERMQPAEALVRMLF